MNGVRKLTELRAAGVSHYDEPHYGEAGEWRQVETETLAGTTSPVWTWFPADPNGEPDIHDDVDQGPSWRS